MALADKYGDVLALAQQLGVRNGNWKEEDGKIHMWGTTEYQLEANQLWDKIKEHSNWENEVAANIQADKKDILGLYTVQSGDTLSKLAQRVYGDAKRYPAIFEANRDQLKDPDKIQVGQKLKIPNP